MPATPVWIRPEPLNTTDGVRVVDRHDEVAEIAQELLRGESVCVGDLYSTGLAILAETRRTLSPDPQHYSFAQSRVSRRSYREASHHLLAPIVNHQIALRKAPSSGWLEELYPDVGDFRLPFPQVQGLNSSWQWHERGIQLPVLSHPLHPFYGTYFPTRFDHLVLFATWLQDFAGERELAFDIGTGCGVLALQLSDAGFTRVVATDINPNAIESVRRELQRHPASAVEPVVADLFGTQHAAADLVVFNPPWIPGEAEGPIDMAIYYQKGLFERFFEAANACVSDDGRLVVLFSNLSKELQVETEHPVELELSANSRFRLLARLESNVRAASKQTRRRKRSVGRETVELWVLGKAAE